MVYRLLNGSKVRELRETRIGSQAQLADLVGVSVYTVNRWETGKMQPRAKQFVKLVEVFHCLPDELLILEQRRDVVSDSQRA